MSNARKLFRLFKYLNEYVKAKAVMEQKMESTDRILAIAIRVAFALYWWFDNLVVLIKIKFFTSLNLARINLNAFRFWTLALVLMLIDCIRKLMKHAAKDAELRKKKEMIGKEGGPD